MKLILFGAPGAGKGTQASAINEALKIPTISTGNIIREAISKGTEAGLQAKQYTEKGALVPDEVVVKMLSDRISRDDCANGYVLDGFPRTIPQAEALDAMGITIDTVLSLEVDDSAIEERMSGRRVCPCGESYHLKFNPPAKEGVCDKCGAALVQRVDDKAETVRERLRVYHELTEPVKAFYEKRGKLVCVDGNQSVEATTQLIFKALGL
ncbi:MAG: adenylate kinase [Ruminococcaceae bacterium]|nr:adenylate kinase [Oscillospiraceae bacterium]MBQ4048170.1 adenylate kinase [Clostridia bacterium]MBQ5796245.1 adenylate kinase [Kiritimatiellia bacterium]